MARSILLSLASTRVFVGTLMVSFFGCFPDLGGTQGACQPSSMPLDECTIPKCNADGTPAYEPVPNAEMRACNLGENQGVCVDGTCALLCVTGMTTCKCDSDASCPTSTPCKMWACEAGECKSTQKPDDTVVDTLEIGDCKKLVCQAGEPQVAQDAADAPQSVECTVFTCDNGMVKAGNAAPGATCTAGLCDTTGTCVPCLTKPNWDACGGNNCPTKLCTAEPCSGNADCQTGFCADGYCCNSACTDECKSCRVAGTIGTCTNIPYLNIDTSYTDKFGTQNVMCSNVRLCNGMGTCLVRIGNACNVNQDCLSGKCAPTKVCLGAKDESCTANGQCASGTCTNNKCT